MRPTSSTASRGKRLEALWPTPRAESLHELRSSVLRRGRGNPMNCAAPPLNGLRLCFVCGGSPGSEALAVVDVHEPSEQGSSVRPVGPPLRVFTHRESLM